MQRNRFKRRRGYVYRLAAAQVSVTFVCLLAGFAAGGSIGVLSALKGALVALIPQALFVLRAGILNPRLGALQGAKRLLRAEMGKFGLTVALFTLTFVLAPPSNPAFFFSAYVAVVLTHWLGPWLLRRHRSTYRGN
ncbi:ATP synthase subunit I [Vreelandella jeotgali]|uniref:ATP synthase subunit I n=1 Tax=Vreelandella jeotgali TaxID=553386 RepID=UPI0003478E2C|nr:ATP synthase subunit I [Halomonas jeotgali]